MPFPPCALSFQTHTTPWKQVIFYWMCVQMLATVVVLWVGKAARVISFPDCDESIPRKVRPISIHLSLMMYSFFFPQYPYIYIYLFYRRSLYLSFMWEIRSLACLELRGWSKSSPLNYLGWRDVDSVPSWAHWAWVLIFGQVKAIYVLFHQLADVYCPQTILHLIHNAGWGSSAQVRLYMRDNPFFCETPSCCLCTV